MDYKFIEAKRLIGEGRYMGLKVVTSYLYFSTRMNNLIKFDSHYRVLLDSSNQTLGLQEVTELDKGKYPMVRRRSLNANAMSFPCERIMKESNMPLGRYEFMGIADSPTGEVLTFRPMTNTPNSKRPTAEVISGK